jgi:CSLREA domain-containing protein
MGKLYQLNGMTRLTIALAVCLLAFASPYHLQPAAASEILAGTTINVTTQADEFNSDGDCSLREALRAANLNMAVDACPAGSGMDSIAIEPGTYNLTRLGSGEDEGLTGDLDILDSVTIVGASLTSTIIDGQGSDRIFQVIGEFQVKFLNLTIQNGFAPAESLYGGGGILNGSPGTVAGSVQVINCLFTQNHAENTGGGMENVGTASLLNVTFSSNEAAVGAGIFSDGTLVVDNVLFVQNTASTTGGGIDNHSGATIRNVTFSGNTSAEGGGLFNDGTLTILNTTLTGNNTALVNNGIIRTKNTIFSSSTAGDNCAGNGTFTSLGHNLEDTDTCGLHGVGDQVNANPMLGPLQNNEGPTLTHALLPGSPAIDSGDDTDCPLQDQRGAYRPADGDSNNSKVCDMGAFEAAGVFPFYTFLPSVSRH